MNGRVHVITRVYHVLLAFYPSGFRAEFGEEMQDVFATALTEVQHPGGEQLWSLLLRELRDLPGSVWRENLRARKGIQMNENPTWQSFTTKELLTAMALFLIPILPAILVLLFGYQPAISSIHSAITICLMIFILVVVGLGFQKGVPRYTVPFLGIVVTAIVMLEPSWRIWELFYKSIQRAIGYYTKILQVRVLYSTLRAGFFWFMVFVAAVILILLLAAWSRTRQLTQHIRRDWTLFSKNTLMMSYGKSPAGLAWLFWLGSHSTTGLPPSASRISSRSRPGGHFMATNTKPTAVSSSGGLRASGAG